MQIHVSFHSSIIQPPCCTLNLTLVAFIQTVAAVLKPDLQWTINIEQAQFLENCLNTSVHIPKITEHVRPSSCVQEQALVFVSGT